LGFWWGETGIVGTLRGKIKLAARERGMPKRGARAAGWKRRSKKISRHDATGAT